MTTTDIGAIVVAPFEAGSRPGIVDRTVMRISLMMLLWARHHAAPKPERTKPERTMPLVVDQRAGDIRRYDETLLISRSWLTVLR